MSISNKFKLIFALVLFAGNVMADLVIDNQAIPSADINQIYISPATGDLFVNTVPGYTVTRVVVGDSVAVTSFYAAPATIGMGQNTTLNWATSNATSCTATNNAGVGAWTGSVNTNGSQTVTLSTAGTFTFTLTCMDASGGQGAASTQVTVNPASVVSVDSFFASPPSISEGQNTTLNWATSNATSCTASNTAGVGGWTGSVNTNGSQIVTLSTAGTFTFTLTCMDASGGQDSASTQVTASPAAGECDASPLSGQTRTWGSFWGYNFPAPGYANKDVTIAQYGYIALQFNTGNIVDFGAVSTVETTATNGLRLGAISTCPGDFNVPNECKHIWGIGGSVVWATNGRTGACQLDPNTDYYFNVTFTDGFDPTESTCNGYPCTATIQAINP